ncbi:hypothetical protein OROMI_015546 [Orobanche minor]
MGAPQFKDGVRGRKLKVLLLSACLWGLVVVSLSWAGRLPDSRRKLEVEKHLRRFNKPATKTIKSPDGDVIDCVHIDHQPAFDHPFLKDHKIQTRPSYHPQGLSDENQMLMGSKERRDPKIQQLWHVNGMCPEDTIPIRRTKKEDLLRANSLKDYGKKKKHTGFIHKPESAVTTSTNQKDHEYAIAYVVGEKYYGAKATINVWEPKIQQPNEFSLSQIWVLGGPIGEGLNSIEAGWQVSPDLYGDNNARFFTYWTSDAYKATGCYNLLCSGFVQTNNTIAMGATISPVSTYGDSHSQFDITVFIWMDNQTGDWWMQFGNDCVMGYWPSSLFSDLKDGATMIQLGGEIVNSKPDGQHTSTQMGSGHFPDENYSKSSYFRSIQVVDSSNNYKSPDELKTHTDNPNCYNIKTTNDDSGPIFYYGGPGLNANCP